MSRLRATVEADAYCRQVGTEPFYSDDEDTTKSWRATDAKALCAKCPVRDRCLELALTTNEQHGVFGGLTVQERRELTAARISNRMEVAA